LNYPGKSGCKSTATVGDLDSQSQMVDSQFKARQSIKQKAKQLEISSQNAVAEGILVGVVGPER